MSFTDSKHNTICIPEIEECRKTIEKFHSFVKGMPAEKDLKYDLVFAIERTVAKEWEEAGHIQVCPSCGIVRIPPETTDWWRSHGGECYRCHQKTQQEILDCQSDDLDELLPEK